MKISKIKIGSRFRKDMGDIQELADSIQKQGLLQSIGVNEKNELIFGLRRIEAVKLLGWENIDAKVVNVTSLIEGEITENEVRKDFSLDEKVAVGKMIEQQLGERRGNPSFKRNAIVAILPQLKTRDIVAKKIGFNSGRIYDIAKFVSEKASNETKSKLDNGKIVINQAYNEIKKEERKKKIEQIKNNAINYQNNNEIKLCAQLYFCGYVNKEHIGYDKFWILNIARLRTALMSKYTIQEMENQFLRYNKPPAKASFFAIPFEILENMSNVIIYKYPKL